MFSPELKNSLNNELKDIQNFLNRTKEIKKIAYVCLELKKISEKIDSLIEDSKIKFRRWANGKSQKTVNILKSNIGSVSVSKKADTILVKKGREENLIRNLENKFSKYFKKETKITLKKNWKKTIEKEEGGVKNFIEKNLERKSNTSHVHIKIL